MFRDYHWSLRTSWHKIEKKKLLLSGPCFSTIICMAVHRRSSASSGEAEWRSSIIKVFGDVRRCLLGQIIELMILYLLLTLHTIPSCCIMAFLFGRAVIRTYRESIYCANKQRGIVSDMFVFHRVVRVPPGSSGESSSSRLPRSLGNTRWWRSRLHSNLVCLASDNLYRTLSD